MRLKQQWWWSGLMAAVLGGLVSVTAVAAAGEQSPEQRLESIHVHDPVHRPTG